MSSEEPVRQVPDEMFRRVSAKPERAIPDALFGPPPAKEPEPVESAEAETPETEGDDSVAAAESDEGADEPVASAAVSGSGAEPAAPADEPPEGVAAASDTGESVAVESVAVETVAVETVAVETVVVETVAVETVAVETTAESVPSGAALAGEAVTDAVESVPDEFAVQSTNGDESASVTADSAVDVEPVAAGIAPSAVESGEAVIGDVASVDDAVESASTDEPQQSARPVLLVIADSLSYFGPQGGLPADHPKIWPNLVGAELDWDVELIGRIGWTCRDAYWALIGDPRVWSAVPRAGAVVFAVGGMDTLPSPLPTALRELIRYVRPPALRRGVRATYNWLQPKLSKLGRPVALPPKVSVDYLEQSREALAQLRPDLPVIAVLPSVHDCAAYGRVHSGRERAVQALRAWSSKTSVPLVDLGDAVRDNIFSGAANPDGIHWGWAGHTAVANSMVKTLQEVR